MGKAFLVICSIIIKGNIMVMDKDPLIILCNSPFYSLVSFFLTSEVQCFSVWCGTDIDLTAFSVFPAACTICMHNRGKQHVRIGCLALGLCF